jgi:hypothetical protein
MLFNDMSLCLFFRIADFHDLLAREPCCVTHPSEDGLWLIEQL